jgi:hypothetical protein
MKSDTPYGTGRIKFSSVECNELLSANIHFPRYKFLQSGKDLSLALLKANKRWSSKGSSCWRFKRFGTCSCVLTGIVSGVPKELGAFVFRAEDSLLQSFKMLVRRRGTMSQSTWVFSRATLRTVNLIGAVVPGCLEAFVLLHLFHIIVKFSQ